MSKTTSISKQSKLLKAFQAGAVLTSHDIRRSFGLSNPHDAVYNLRRQGYCIYGNSTKCDARVIYKLGKPTKEIVALATMIGGSSLFNK